MYGVGHCYLRRDAGPWLTQTVPLCHQTSARSAALTSGHNLYKRPNGITDVSTGVVKEWTHARSPWFRG